MNNLCGAAARGAEQRQTCAESTYTRRPHRWSADSRAPYPAPNRDRAAARMSRRVRAVWTNSAEAHG